MNIIFLDFDGVITTNHDNSKEIIEKRVSVLSDICKKNNCKVVITSSIRNAVVENVETELVWVKGILELFKKHNIDFIGTTDSLSKRVSKYVNNPVLKDDDIRCYLFDHPEVEHYCVIDDNNKNDLDKVCDHLVETYFYSENPDEEGLLTNHKEQVNDVLKKDNKIRTMLLKYSKKD